VNKPTKQILLACIELILTVATVLEFSPLALSLPFLYGSQESQQVSKLDEAERELTSLLSLGDQHAPIGQLDDTFKNYLSAVNDAATVGPSSPCSFSYVFPLAIPFDNPAKVKLNSLMNHEYAIAEKFNASPYLKTVSTPVPGVGTPYTLTDDISSNNSLPMFSTSCGQRLNFPDYDWQTVINAIIPVLDGMLLLYLARIYLIRRRRA
jgi:hypothetical protein